MRKERQYKGGNEKLRKTVYCITTNEVYESINAAAAALGLNIGNVSACCNGRQKSTRGYEFEFYTEVIDNGEEET